VAAGAGDGGHGAGAVPGKLSCLRKEALEQHKHCLGCQRLALPPLTAQVPSLEEIWWVSALGTVSSLCYVFIALILGLIYSERTDQHAHSS
jgi:hypothetical protein